MAKGSLGNIVEWESHFDRYSSVYTTKGKRSGQAGEGLLYDLGVHLLDQAVVALGSPARVSAVLTKPYADCQAGMEQFFSVSLFYQNGSLATLKASTVSTEDSQLRFWIRGDKGSYKKVHDPYDPSGIKCS